MSTGISNPLVWLTVLVAISNIASARPLAAPTGVALLDDPILQCWHPLPDFSYAGYRHGTEPLPRLEGTVIDVRDHGAVADDNRDDSQAILKALAVANSIAGPVVIQLPPGRLIVSEVLPIERSDIVVRGYGKGTGGSEIYFPRPLKMVDRTNRLDELRKYLSHYDKRQVEADRNINLMFSEYSWTGGFFWVGSPGSRPAAYLPAYDRPSREQRISAAVSGVAGERVLRVKSTAGISSGDVVQVRWFNRGGPDGALLGQIYGETELEIGSHHWSFPDRPLVVQAVAIESISGNELTLSAPLLHDVGPGLEADVARWRHLKHVGIEDMALVFPANESFGHHLEQGYNGVYLTGVFDGWIRDVRIENADSGVLSYNSANVTISGVETGGTRRAHYSVHLGNVHNFLVTGLKVFNQVVHPLSVNTQSTRSVFHRSEVFVDPVIDQHAGSNHQNLFDALTLHITAIPSPDGPRYDLWQGSGARYWEPGHGRYNTSWNLRVIVQGGAHAEESVTLAGTAEGPDARVVGLWGNRQFQLDYRPSPYQELVNATPSVTSLYEHQLARRSGGGAPPPECGAGHERTSVVDDRVRQPTSKGGSLE